MGVSSIFAFFVDTETLVEDEEVDVFDEIDTEDDNDAREPLTELANSAEIPKLAEATVSEDSVCKGSGFTTNGSTDDTEDVDTVFLRVLDFPGNVSNGELFNMDELKLLVCLREIAEVNFRLIAAPDAEGSDRIRCCSGADFFEETRRFLSFFTFPNNGNSSDRICLMKASGLPSTTFFGFDKPLPLRLILLPVVADVVIEEAEAPRFVFMTNLNSDLRSVILSGMEGVTDALTAGGDDATVLTVNELVATVLTTAGDALPKPAIDEAAGASSKSYTDFSTGMEFMDRTLETIDDDIRPDPLDEHMRSSAFCAAACLEDSDRIPLLTPGCFIVSTMDERVGKFEMNRLDAVVVASIETPGVDSVELTLRLRGRFAVESELTRAVLLLAETFDDEILAEDIPPRVLRTPEESFSDWVMRRWERTSELLIMLGPPVPQLFARDVAVTTREQGITAVAT